MRGRGIAARRGADLIVIGVLYAIVSAGAYAFVLNAMTAGSGFLDLRSSATVMLLSITPAAMLALLAVWGARFLRDIRRKAWGYKLRGKVIVSFLAVAVMAAGPPTIMLGLLANRAVTAPSAAAIRAAVGDGLDFALSYYAEKESALKYAAENDIASTIAARGPDADRLLARLSARDPSFCAVELFAAGRSIAFAGDPAARSASGAAAMDKNGFLPRVSANGRSYARYFARDGGSTAAHGRISAVIALRFPQRVEDAAGGLSSAISAIEQSGRIAGSFRLYLIFFAFSLAFPMVAIAVLFAMASADSLQRPVSALSDALDRVRDGARRAPFLAKPGDEAGDVIEALNRVLEGLEKSRGDELRNEKIGAWRDIARKLAHELRNPLTPIKLSAERVLKRWNADPSTIGDILEKSMVAIVQETCNMESLLTEFRDFARLPEPQKDWMELKPMVEEAVHLYSASWPSMTMDCSGIDDGIVLKADRGYLKQALGNLIANAADATGGAGRVWIRADLVKTAESRYCRIQVRDDGCGIPEESQDKVFSPYFTTKPGGTGLGLAIVEHIVAAHGGRIRFDSGANAGTVFYIDLPAESE